MCCRWWAAAPNRGNPEDRTSYYAWGQPLRAPGDGVVATVVDRFPDQQIGSVDVVHTAGNHVVIDLGAGKFVAFGHLQSGSVRVSVGDQVRRGDLIALVGNSGNSDQPHLHLQAQNSPTFDVINPPVGAEDLPPAVRTACRGARWCGPASGAGRPETRGLLRPTRLMAGIRSGRFGCVCHHVRGLGPRSGRSGCVCQDRAWFPLRSELACAPRVICGWKVAIETGVWTPEVARRRKAATGDWRSGCAARRLTRKWRDHGWRVHSTALSRLHGRPQGRV
jgi:hypothetical protein